MKEIKLTRGLKAKVDDQDYEWLNQWKWSARKSGNTFYATRHSKTVNGKRHDIIMHRLILNVPKGMQTDHADTDGLNNQRYNIRVCTQRENAQNRKRYKGSASQYKGVHWNLKTKKWHAHIRFNGKLLYISYHDTEEAAARAYDTKAIELFGDFARTNFNQAAQAA